MYGVPDETVERLRGLEGVLAVWVEEREQTQVLSVQTRADVQLTAAILGHLNGTNVGRVSHREPTLEDAYVALVTARMRTLRLLGVGWLYHLKMISRSPFEGYGQVIYPLFFATVAFFVFRAGDSPRTLVYASLGAAVMGMWSATSTTAGAAMQRERWHGTLELLVGTPRPLRARPPARHARHVDDRDLQPRSRPCSTATSCSGSTSRSCIRCCSRSSIVGTVLSFGALGFVFAVTFVRFRAAWALGNLFEYPVWLIGGFLVPLGLLPHWVRPISWVLAPTWGMNAIRESALGGVSARTTSCSASGSAPSTSVSASSSRSGCCTPPRVRAALSLS